MSQNKSPAQELLESWLNQKYDDLMIKLDQDNFSTEDMIILILKEQNEYIQKLEQELKKLK